MEPNNSQEHLIEYIALCGLQHHTLVDYTLSLEESRITEGLSKECLKNNGLVPEIISMYPEEKPGFPLVSNFVDVTYYLTPSIVFHWDMK